MKQYVILLARRSTEEQKDSFNYQIKETLSAFPKYKPHKIIQISETGDNKKDNPRKKFKNQFVKLVKNKLKEGYEVICLAHAIDRFTRNYADLGTIESLYNEGTRFYTTDGNLATDEDASLFGVKVAFAKMFLTNTKKKQKAGLINKIRDGRVFCGHIPGYIPTQTTGIRKPHPLQKKAIIKFFEDYSTAKYSLISYLPIAKKVGQKYGLKISSIERLRTILRNKFYIGIYEYKGKHKELQNEVIKHKSKTFLSKDLFNKVQDILDNRHHKKTFQHDFLYRGKVKTINGNLMVGSIKKKKYVYYEDKKGILKALNSADIDFAL